MRRLKRMLCAAALMAMTAGVCLAQQANPGVADKGARLGQGVDLLSDTQGVNFQPYLAEMLGLIHAQWATLVPLGARPGATEIRLSIQPDGTISAMRMEDSAQDEVLNRAAWGALTGVGQLPPLPAKFHGPDLEMRVHFVVNQ